MLRQKSFARFLTFPENKAALQAVQDVSADIRSGKLHRLANPLFLHGPPGTGKSHLMSALVGEVSRNSGLTVQMVSAADFREPVAAPPPAKKLAVGESDPLFPALGDEARACDLLILEDVQHLPWRAAETLVQIMDYRLAHQRPMLFTATVGPRHLAYRGVRLPARLTSRLAAGLVVALEPLQAESRQTFLKEVAQRRQLALDPEILAWLAQHLTGGTRQLEGALSQLETLNKVGRQPINLKKIVAHFQVQVEATRPTVQRIASLVGDYFRIDPDQLQSRRRHRNVLLPRQVGMYLSRQLTELSLGQIGAYFGGRDHTTVLHACRKVEQAMQKDAVLSGTVRQIHADLA